MDSAIWGFIGTIVGAIIGASASILTTIINGRKSVQLQKERDNFERLERSREFQRNTLLELQDSLLQNLRLIARAHLEDLASYRQNDGVRNNLLSAELNQDIMLSNRKNAILTERISDDELRNNLKKLRQDMNDVLLAKSENESLNKLQIVSSNFEKFMEELGVVLRNNY